LKGSFTTEDTGEGCARELDPHGCILIQFTKNVKSFYESCTLSLFLPEEGRYFLELVHGGLEFRHGLGDEIGRLGQDIRIVEAIVLEPFDIELRQRVKLS
jgi:hypothetical protein